jgi:transposase InsO family protein
VLGLCRLLGYSTQAYYQYQQTLQKRSLREDLLILEVLTHRRLQPRIGGRKLLHLLEGFMEQHDIHIGRDAFFELLAANGLLVRRRRSPRPRTTFSNHHYRRYADLSKGLKLNQAGELWVSDITYISLKKGHAYLSLVTDAYSRKIQGFLVSPDLTIAGPMGSLQMALEQRGPAWPLIHHSDRGSQYCCHAYVELLNQNGISISMTQSGDPRDNAIAERVNGILKQELLEPVYASITTARQAVKQAVEIYNTLRPHSSVDMLTPDKAHQRKGDIRRRWNGFYKMLSKQIINPLQD